MANTWFRFYNEALNDPKVQNLPGDVFKAWVNILCIASANDGEVDMTPLAFMLRSDEKVTIEIVTYLQKVNLLRIKNGKLVPHNWDKRQHKSDSSAERMRRHRDKKRDVTVTPPDTDTDSEAETDNKKEAKASKKVKIYFDFDDRKWRGITGRDVQQWKEAYPACEIETQLKAAGAWLVANPTQKKTNYIRFIVNWLSRHQDSGGDRQRPASLFSKPEGRYSEERKNVKVIS